MASWLWNEVHELFDTDDGSLPEILVKYRRAEATAEGYGLLRSEAAPGSTEDATFWSTVENDDRPVDSVQNAASLVLSSESEAFHVVLAGIRSGDTVIPALGVFVFPDELALDYRMGKAWGAAEVEGLFRLLLRLLALDAGASIIPGRVFPPDPGKRFEKAWRRYRSEHAA